MEILQVSDVKKTYTTRLGGNRVQALKGVTFSVQEGEYVAIMGESGSGKNHPAEHPGGPGQAHGRRGAFVRQKSGDYP